MEEREEGVGPAVDELMEEVLRHVEIRNVPVGWKHLTSGGVYRGHPFRGKGTSVLRVAAVNLASRMNAGSGKEHGAILARYMRSAGIDVLLGGETFLTTQAAIDSVVAGFRQEHHDAKCVISDKRNGGVLVAWAKPHSVTDWEVHPGGRAMKGSCVVSDANGNQHTVDLCSVYGVSGATGHSLSPEELAEEADVCAWVRGSLGRSKAKGHTMVVGGDLNSIVDDDMDAIRTSAVARSASLATTLDGCTTIN
jgi:hypothetical protein